MQSGRTRIVLAAVMVAIAASLFVVLKGSDGGDGGGEPAAGQGPAKAPIPTIVVKSGKPVGGARELDYAKGDQVHFKVVSDVSDEVHVHGYDIGKDVKAGGTVSFDFPADIEGVFEAELERRGEQIAELRVNP